MSDFEPPTPEAAVAQATALLGEPEALFRASPRWLRAKFFASIGLIVYGLVANVLWFGFGPARPDHVILHLLFVPPVIGIVLLTHMWRHRGLRVLVYPEGLMRIQPHAPASFRFDDIRAVRCKLDIQGTPQIERDGSGQLRAVTLETSAPTFQVWNVWIEVHRRDGETARFNAALDDFPDLVHRILRGTFPHLWAQAQAALAAGDPVAFGETLSVRGETIIDGKLKIQWSDIKVIKFSGKFLNVKRNGAWIAAIAREHSSIENLHVLLGLAAERNLLELDDED